MALTSNGIQEAREIFAKISNETSKFIDVNEVINFMNSNEEFSKFISGTTFGNENYEKWQKLLNLVSNDLYQAMLNLNNATAIFLERQEQYNSSLSFGTVSGSGPAPIVGTTGPIDGGLEFVGAINKNFPGSPGPVYETPGFVPEVPTYTS